MMSSYFDCLCLHSGLLVLIHCIALGLYVTVLGSRLSDSFKELQMCCVTSAGTEALCQEP